MSTRAVDLAISQFECKCHALIADLKAASKEHEGDALVAAIEEIGSRYGMTL